MIDHKTKLEENVLATLNRRGVLRGMGAGAMAIATGSLAAHPARADAGGHIKLAGSTTSIRSIAHFTSFFGAIKIHNNIYNGLLKVAVRRQARVVRAGSCRDVDDQRRQGAHLQAAAGVKFHDGTPCDAEAVKWSVERVWKGTPKSNHAWKYKELASVDVLDPLTVRLTFNKPYAFLPVALTGSTGRAGTIVSRAAVEKYGDKFGRNPVGTGPFKFVSWRENDSVVLEKNPDYFEKAFPSSRRPPMVIMKEPSAAVARNALGPDRRHERRAAAVRDAAEGAEEPHRLRRDRRQLRLLRHEHEAGPFRRHQPAPRRGLRHQPRGDHKAGVSSATRCKPTRRSRRR